MRFESKNKKEHIEMGEYVLTRVRNAFNNKTSYWLSKKGYTVAQYAFTAEDCVDAADFQYHLSAAFLKEIIAIYEDLVHRRPSMDFADREMNPKDIKQEADNVELKLFKDRATGRTFTYFSDKGVFYVFENDCLFYKGASDNIQQTIEEKRGEVEFIALTKEQECSFSPKATDFHGHYVFSDVKGLEGVWYRTDIVRPDGTRVYTKFQ